MPPRARILALALAALISTIARPCAHAATVGPIEELPAAQGMGREAFPVDPIGRTWSYVRGDGTRVRREIRKWDYECILRELSGADCYERALATVAIGSDGSPGRERVLTVDACRDRWVRHALDWRDPGGEWTPLDLAPRVWFPLEFPLHTGLSWDDTSNDVDLLKRKEETGPVKPDTRYRVLGKASVGVIAGRFPITVVVESTPIQSSAPPARRVFYAANVGPVLEQAQDATGTWITDFELESYEAKPATVIVRSDKQLTGRDAHLTAVPSPVGSANPSAAETGPIKPIPDGVTIGREIFPVEPLGRAWNYRMIGSGDAAERRIVPIDELQRVEARSPFRMPGTGEICPELGLRSEDLSSERSSLERMRVFACRNTVLAERIFCGASVFPPPVLMPFPLTHGAHWSQEVPDLGEMGHWLGGMPRELLGRARVITPAGSFEDAVLIETAEPAHGDTPARAVRRTYYATNVGPVLVLVPEPDSRWVADLVLESIVVPPPPQGPPS